MLFTNPRPRERVQLEGPEQLSTQELIALILRTGTAGATALDLATSLLDKFGNLDGMSRAGDAELRRIDGLGPAKAASLRAAFELGSRRLQAPLNLGERLEDPAQVHAYFGPFLRHLRQEVFYALLLDSRQRLIRQVEVSRGSLSQSLVHPREVFGPALRESAASLIVLHNHPSGDPRPSKEDVQVTRRLESAGELLGIRVLDHIVVAADQFFSFAKSSKLLSQAPPGGHR